MPVGAKDGRILIDGAVPGPIFPVLAFDQYSFTVKESVTELTTAWTSLIKSGWFSDLTLIDSAETTFTVMSATPVAGVGWFWGFNPLYGRRVALSLRVKRSDHQLTLEEARKQLLGMLRSWYGWQSRDDFDMLTDSIESARSFAEVMSVVREAERRSRKAKA